ncbi:hypothetical protein M405DRAFT_250264 [Rhizopogon salebrosus TDB-379]|nr:hypothetical protein M405DRAFT_250264 [Rhizopogon salebrosus TDB-379]
MAGAHPSGFNPHLPGFRYQFLAKTLGATMWFFIFYRAREDGPKLLVFSLFFSDCYLVPLTQCLQGLRHPWEGHGHGHHEEHSEHH